MGKQGIVLKNSTDRPLVRRQIRNINSIQYDSACVRRFKTTADAQQRCLAASAGTKQRKDFTLVDRERNIVNDGVLTIPFCDVFKTQDFHFLSLFPYLEFFR